MLMLSNEDVERAKPHPDIYQKAMRHFGLLPEQCLIVEDNEKGIAAARASGAHYMVVQDVTDVNLDNIDRHIRMAEGGVEA